MENNEHFYRAEYNSLLTQNQSFQKALQDLRESSLKQAKLLEECWERIYYSNKWLTLSNDNIDGMKKHIEQMKKDGRYDKLMLEE
jgi:hypothetical protein